MRLNSAVTNALVTDPTDISGVYGNYESCLSVFPGSCIPNLINSSFPTLDRTLGYSVFFNLQINAETHNDANRAGFSVTVIGDDLIGIEISFWDNAVWAQHDGTTGVLFTRGETVTVGTTTLSQYELRVLASNYQLLQNSVPILSGALRDYTAFDHQARVMAGFIPVPLPYDPYETANLLFLGDNTSRAHANADLTLVSVSTNTTPTVSGDRDSTIWDIHLDWRSCGVMAIAQCKEIAMKRYCVGLWDIVTLGLLSLRSDRKACKGRTNSEPLRRVSGSDRSTPAG